jgi:hypothetical protein
MIFEDVHWIHPTSLEVVGRTGGSAENTGGVADCHLSTGVRAGVDCLSLIELRQGPSIILCGSTGALPPPSTDKEGAMDSERRSVRAACHQRHHRRPEAARGMFQTGMKAKAWGGGRQMPRDAR